MEENSKNNENNSDQMRSVVYGRPISRIPGYIDSFLQKINSLKPLRQINNFGETFTLLFPSLERSLFILGLGYVMGDIKGEYTKDKAKDRIYRELFLLDISLWHALSSFILPTIFISKSIQFFVYFLHKLHLNNRYCKITSILFSLGIVYVAINPIDRVSDTIMNNTYRRIVDYKKYDTNTIINNNDNNIILL